MFKKGEINNEGMPFKEDGNVYTGLCFKETNQ